MPGNKSHEKNIEMRVLPDIIIDWSLKFNGGKTGLAQPVDTELSVR